MTQTLLTVCFYSSAILLHSKILLDNDMREIMVKFSHYYIIYTLWSGLECLATNRRSSRLSYLNKQIKT